MDEIVRTQYLADAITTFRAYKDLAERAISQLTDEEFFATIDEESNSIAVLMKHLAGNMISRWTDFLTSDGEKPDRDRDLEFVIESTSTRAELLAYWERGWHALSTALEPLQASDFDKQVRIRGEAHSVVQAINRQLTHYAYHIGQIVFLAKHFRKKEWQSLSVPRNRSSEFNAYLANKAGATKHPMDEAAKFAARLKDK